MGRWVHGQSGNPTGRRGNVSPFILSRRKALKAFMDTLTEEQRQTVAEMVHQAALQGRQWALYELCRSYDDPTAARRFLRHTGKMKPPKAYVVG